MSKIVQTSLIVRKETKFDKIRRSLLMLFWGEEYYLIQRIDKLMEPKRINPSKIIIPREIGKGKKL